MNRSRITSTRVALLAGLVFAALSTGSAFAATFAPVDVAGLVAAINTANTNGEDDVIDLGGRTFTLTTVDNTTDGPNGLPGVLGDGGRSLTIRNGTIERDPAAPLLRFFRISADATLSLETTTLRSGSLRTLSSWATGAAILNFGALTVVASTISDNDAWPGTAGAVSNSGSLSVITSVFSGNFASFAGAIGNDGTLAVSGCTFARNGAEFEGGAIWNFATILAIRNSTFSENGTLRGGAIYNQGSIRAISNSTFAFNWADFAGYFGGAVHNSASAEILELTSTILARDLGDRRPDLTNSGVIVSASDNLIGVGEGSGIVDGVDGNQVGSVAAPLDPLVGPLADNGGPTLTHALLAESPAIDRGSNPEGLEWDQRGAGFARVSGARADAGAYEVQMAALTLTIVDMPDPVAAGHELRWTVTLRNDGTGVARGVLLSDPLPAGTTFASLTAPAGWSCTTPAVGSNGTVACSAASFPPGSAVFTIVATVSPATAAGTLLTTTVTATSTSPDPDASATETTTVLEPGSWDGPPVPALGSAGLGLLASLVALGGALVAGRRLA